MEICGENLDTPNIWKEKGSKTKSEVVQEKAKVSNTSKFKLWFKLNLKLKNLRFKLRLGLGF